MISETGENLSVLICCDHVFAHDWMTFLSYYSFRTFLPDAKLAIACERNSLIYDLFKWAKRLDLNFEIIKPKNKLEYLQYFQNKNKIDIPCLITTPDIICLKEWSVDFLPEQNKNYIKNNFMFIQNIKEEFVENENLYCCIKENKISHFATYSNGWFDFNMSVWINKKDYPFYPSFHQNKNLMSFNEKKMYELWKSCSLLLEVLFRG